MTTPQSPQAPSSPESDGAAPFQYAEAVQAKAAAPKKSKRKKLLSVLGIIVTIIVVAIVKVAIKDVFSDGPVHAKVGDCVTVTGSDNNPKVDKVGCGDSKATHTVSKVIDNSFDVNACGDGFDALAQQMDDEKFVLCLTPKK